MNDDQNTRLRMYASVEKVLAAYPDALTSMPVAQTAADAFRAKRAALLDALAERGEVIRPTEEKNQLRKTMASAAVGTSQALAVWAEMNDTPDLAEEVGFPLSAFLYGRERDSLDRAAFVLRKAQEHTEALADYGVTQDEVDTLATHVDAFADAIGEPRAAIARRGAVTERIEKQFAEIDRLLARRLDRLVVRLDGTDFQAAYTAARRLV